MSNRHLSRTMAMQALYEWDFRSHEAAKAPEIIKNIMEEFAPNFDDEGYIKSQVEGVLSKVKEIDELLAHFAPDWPIAEMTVVDRNIFAGS